MNNRALHFSIITLFSIGGVIAPQVSNASADSCLVHYSETALSSPRAVLSKYFASPKFKGFLFTADAKESTQTVLKIVSGAQSGGDYVNGLRAVLAIKSNWYMGGTADNNFNDQVLSGLFQSSKKYTLTSAEKAEISEAIQSYANAKYGSIKALIYKNFIWGKNEFASQLSQYTSSKDFKGFLSVENAKKSTNQFVAIVSNAKTSGDFIDALSAVLAHKSNWYLGGLADKNFNSFVLPELFKLSRQFDLSSQEKLEIKTLLKNYAESAWGSKTALLYVHAVWGKDQYLDQIEKYFSSPAYKGFLFPDKAVSSAQAILAIISQAQNASEFISAVKAILGYKANIYMGGLADNTFHKLIFPGLLKASRSFILSSQEQTELSQIFREYAKAPFGSPDAISYSNEIWGY